MVDKLPTITLSRMLPPGFWEVDSVASAFQIDDESYAAIWIIGAHILRIIV